MRVWWMLLWVGCQGPSDPGIDASVDATTDVLAVDVGDAQGSTGGVNVRAEATLDGMPTSSIADARHLVDAIRASVDGLEWSSDVSENVRVDMNAELDFFGGTTLALQLPPGRYSVLELDIERLQMRVDGEDVVESESFSVRARCRSVLEVGVGSDSQVSIQIDGETLLDELATRLEDDPASEAIRESFKEAVQLRCD